ncbi:hypothetical protein M5D96_001580, partial [Drosophila gunungcola]
MGLIMAAIKWIHVATLYTYWRRTPSGSISITAALHGASRLRNSTPLSKTHHSNAHLLLIQLAAFCGSFNRGVDSPLFGLRDGRPTHQQFIKTHQYSSKAKTKQTRGTSNSDSIPQKEKTP